MARGSGASATAIGARVEVQAQQGARGTPVAADRALADAEQFADLQVVLRLETLGGEVAGGAVGLDDDTVVLPALGDAVDDDVAELEHQLVEAGTGREAMKPALEALGHKVMVGKLGLKANAAERTASGWVGAADPRSVGTALSE